MEDLLRLIKLIKDETGTQLRLDTPDFNHVAISSECDQLRGFYHDKTLCLDRSDQYDEYHDCPIKFRCTDVRVADKVNPLIYQVKFILSAKKEFSNNIGEN